jgi:hypothetical protein
MQGGGEVAPRLFVFPAETAPFPDIGPAVAATRLFGSVFKTVVVRIARFVHAEQVAQVVKMPLLAAVQSPAVPRFAPPRHATSGFIQLPAPVLATPQGICHAGRDLQPPLAGREGLRGIQQAL